MLDGPTFPPLHSRAQHKMTVFALEAVDMIIPAQSSDPGSLSLTFLREDGQLAGTTAQCELSVIVLGAVGLVLLVQSDHLTIKLLGTDRALETVVMEPHLPDHQGRVAVSRDLLPAGRAGPGADQLHVVLLAHHHALHHADPLQDDVVTDTADMADTSEIFFTDWKIFVGEILVDHLVPAHLTLNTTPTLSNLLDLPCLPLHTFIHLLWMLVSPKVTWPSVMTSLQTAHLVVE